MLQKCAQMLSIITLSVGNKPIMQSVIKLYVVVLNVIATFDMLRLQYKTLTAGICDCL